MLQQRLMRCLTLSARRMLRAPVWRYRGIVIGHLSEVGASDQADQALGSVNRFRFAPIWGTGGDRW
jgi:hypothetical protein